MPLCLFLRDWYQGGRSTPVKRPFSTIYPQTPATAFPAEPLHQEIPIFSLPARKRRTLPHIGLYLQELEGRALLSPVPVPVLSLNWSGYAAETSLSAPASGAVGSVSGTWIVPTVTGKTNAFSSVWVGIDGYDPSSPTVEQIGTEQDTSSSGNTTYYAWYEMYPGPSILIPYRDLTIHPGDQISASVTYYSSSSSFTLKITDNTTSPDQPFSIDQSVPSGAERSSAEWIVEAPSNRGGGVLPLANFGTVNFTGAQATINGTTGAIDNSSWQNTAINMVSFPLGTTTIATTSRLKDSSDPSSFSVKYTGSGGQGHGHGHGQGQGSNQTVNVISSRPNFQAPAGITPGVTVAPITGTAPMQVSSPGALPAPQGVEAAHWGLLPVNQTDEFYLGRNRAPATAHWGLLPVDWTDSQEEEVPAQPESRPTPPQEWMSDAAPAAAFLANAPAAFLSAELADAAFATVPVWEDSGLALPEQTDSRVDLLPGTGLAALLVGVYLANPKETQEKPQRRNRPLRMFP